MFAHQKITNPPGSAFLAECAVCSAVVYSTRVMADGSVRDCWNNPDCPGARRPDPAATIQAETTPASAAADRIWQAICDFS